MGIIAQSCDIITTQPSFPTLSQTLPITSRFSPFPHRCHAGHVQVELIQRLLRHCVSAAGGKQLASFHGTTVPRRVRVMDTHVKTTAR